MKSTLLCILLLFTSQLVTAQSLTLFRTRKAVKEIKVAQKYINEQKYDDAILKLEETIKIKKDFAVAWRELGKVYFLKREYEKAIEAYEKSFDLNSKLSRAAYFECGESHFKLLQFEQANYYFSKYRAMKDTRYTNKRRESQLETDHNNLLPVREQNYYFAREAIQNPIGKPPVNVGDAINSMFDDYLPTISGNGKIMIFTTKKSYSPVETPTGENIFVSVMTNENKWTISQSLSDKINTPSNEGMAKFAADERYMYFAGCNRTDSYGGCDIYETYMKNYSIIDIRPLKGGVNSEGWDSQPSITCSGDIMFFASNREGGYGGADIWMSEKEADGTWGEAVNLGERINTAGDEEAPFIATDGKTLYFSSTGHPGMGDGDIFMTKGFGLGTDITWTEPRNLGYPINTPYQEVGFFLRPDGSSAYLASSRMDDENVGGLDIYEVKLPEEFQPEKIVLLQGQVVDDLTLKPLMVDVIITRNDDKWIVPTDENGWYFMCLSAKKAYAFQVNENKYEYFMESAFLAAQDNSIPYRFDISLIQKNLPVRTEEDDELSEVKMNIYFDIDTYALNDKNQSQLKAIANQLKAEPEWQVEVIGYADNVGNSAYNLRLSQQRAKAVAGFLKLAGVTTINIRQEGRGAVASTNDTFESEDDRRRQRRVEVILRK